ncbi:hypothetical protein ACIQUQ_30120 [Streptomyces sp. NPDC101118]|uniref:hypothetical protein n=1 Tax=Streptomyces sp. NPDC101118 TaxID=3366109 RepID=UPI00380E4EC6
MNAKTLAAAAALAAAALIAAAHTAAARETPEPPTPDESASSHALTPEGEPEDYWTPERMLAAAPAPMPTEP